MNDDKKETQESKPNEEVSKAFGNDEKVEPIAKEEPLKVDPKTEEEEGKAATPKQENVPSVDKTQSKTYTQAEVDAMMAKARKKYTGKDEEVVVPALVDVPEDEATVETLADPMQSQDLATGITVERLAQAELKAEMAIGGVDPSKVARAVRLIDIMEVMENGQYSEMKAKTAIETLMTEWPELKQSKEENKENQFFFGVPGQDEQNQQEKQKNQFSNIFGNE